MRVAPLIFLFACQPAAERPTAPLVPPVDAAPVESPAMISAPEPELPGVAGDPTLTAELRAAIAARGPDYVARTEHKDPTGRPKYVNRLIRESSPYLLQHAHNPVNWSPWGEEAFARAAASGRPILLSVGYSTCHWCHVMERESFEDVEIATFINAHFVAIKVDREERPDVDDIYMSAVQLLNRGNGGWPMTVVMTPDGAPFFAGTYFPARDGDRGARQGFLTILKALSARYEQDREGVAAHAAEITQAVRRQAEGARPGDVPGPEAMEGAAQAFARTFDPEWGGFGRRPKFPRPVALDFLLRYHARTGDPQALNIVETTLTRMAEGGLYDHLAGGFHRYSTDREWLAPHFEKMLYDNAQLAVTYAAAFQVTGAPRYATVVRETLDYVIRELTTPAGAFYSATDADSAKPTGEQEEGFFFTWTPAEVEAVIGAERAAWFNAYYDVTSRGNFEGRNILHPTAPLAEVAERFGQPPAAFAAALAEAKAALYAARVKRPPPHLDAKVLTAWNGLMISGLAQGARVLGEPRYAVAAARAADFVLTKMRGDDGRLLRTYGDGHAKLNAYLEDYAFLIEGLLDLYEATGAVRWYTAARALQAIQDAHYQDVERGGYYTTSDDHEALLARDKPTYDGALPAGNSVAASNLLRFAEYTSDDAYRQRAERTLAAAGAGLDGGATGQPRLLSALDLYLDVPKQVVLVAPTAGADEALQAVLRGRYLPNHVYARLIDADVAAQAAEIPLLEGKRSQHPGGTAYVCEKGRCERPTGDPKVLAAQLGAPRPLSADRAPAPLAVPAPEATPAPWHYDPKTDRHWHPGHGHWHPGPPPPVDQR